MSNAIRILCQGVTQSGRPCKRYALPDSDYCGRHQPTDELVESDLAGTDIPDPDERQQLIAELDQLIEQLKALSPGYTPPPFSPQALVQLLKENLETIRPELRLGILERLRSTIGQDLFDVDTWKGIWFVLNSLLQYQTDFVKRRVTGEYETDEWGFDQEVFDSIRPFIEFMYRTYWRVQATGLEHIPQQGRALIVANHSGQLPWDGSMVATAVYLEHPAQRLVRAMYDTWAPPLPFFSDLFTKCGQVLATEENGLRLLEQDQLVAVFPEGQEGLGKLFKDRYRLAHFGQGGYIHAALKTQSPIIPVAIVGAEETYISLEQSPTLASLMGWPYFPITPTFPWLGLLGLIPLPTKWYIDFGQPIPTDSYGPEAADHPVTISQLTDQVRHIIQEMIYSRLAERRSIFWS